MVLLLSLFSILFFGALAVVFSLKEEKTRKLLLEREKMQKQRIYQISILKEIQDRIGYSLDIEKVIDVITGSLRNLFPYSSASSFVVKQDKLIFKTYIEEQVSHGFLEQVKKSMLASLSALLETVPTNIDERLSGIPLDDTNPAPLASFFHIPLVIGEKVVGLINVSSTQPNLYKEDEMTILYQITGQASNALSRLEEVLETEKGKLTAMIAGLADGVFMIDSQNTLLIINDAAKNLLSIAKDQPTFFDVMGAMYPTFDLPTKINQSISQNITVEDKEVKVGEKILQVFITPVVTNINAVQKVIGASILLHDITVEKNIAQIKEDFTSMMVHELRAPLTAIKDSSELILETKKPLTKDEHDKFLEIIHRESKVLLSQISQVLDAAKIEAGRFTIEKSEQNLADIILRQVDTFKPQAQKKNISLMTNVDQNLPKVSADPLRISQVLNNLLSNSLKFTPEGGRITISAEFSPMRVARAGEPYAGAPVLLDEWETRGAGERQDPHHNSEPLIEVSVADTGIGIPKDEQKNLFSKFYQTATTPNQLAKKGTGLGLYLVKGIVQAHGGTVSVDSEPGRGTTISFTLPAVDNAQTSEIKDEHLFLERLPN